MFDRIRKMLTKEDQVDALLFATSGSEIVADADQDGLPDAPPPEANYRPADIQGIACWNCSHMEVTGENEDGFPSGVCHLWEAQVQGQNVCDRFTADGTLMNGVDWHKAPQDDYYPDYPMLSEIFVPDDGVEFAEKNGLFRKTILRTGEWDKTPGVKGVKRKKLRIVRDGESDINKGIVSLAELKANFEAKAYPYVTIPLSDSSKDHPDQSENVLRLNQGFVRSVEIEDDEEGSRLVADMEFTEPETRGKVERGTIPDVSAGIYGPIERPDGEKFNAAINHVCLTPKPFMSDLGPFAVLASDDDDPVEHTAAFVPSEEEPEEAHVASQEWDDRLSFSWQEQAVNAALADQLNLSADYIVTDIAPERAVVRNKIAEVEWEVPFKLTDDGIELSAVRDWVTRESRETDEGDQEGSTEPAESAAAPERISLSDDPLQQARQIRELRFSNMENSEGGGTMPAITGTDPLEGVELSDETQVRSVLQRLLDDNQRLRSEGKSGSVDQEIERVKGLGFSEEPGFLTVYRDILLSDDDQPAMVLLSHDESGTETKRENVTATEVAKRLVNALRTNEEGKILLAQQHVSSGSDDPPPVTDETEGKSVAQRTAEAEEALYGKSSDKSAGGE